MQQWKNGLEILALGFALVAAVLVALYSPENLAAIDGGDATFDSAEHERRVARMNRRLKWGVRLVVVSVILQSFSQFVPSEAP